MEHIGVITYLKNDGWKTGKVTFQGRTVKLRELSIGQDKPSTWICLVDALKKYVHLPNGGVFMVIYHGRIRKTSS